MKRLFYTLIFMMSISLFAQAQFNWQGVVRDGSNAPLVSQNVGVQLTIMQDGSMVYRETHATTTTDLGLVNLAICSGTVVSGDCGSIDWSTGNFMLNVAIDAAGGSNYADYGSSPIMSVPRAMFAESAGNVDDADADPTNEIQDLIWDNAERKLSIEGTSTEIRIPSTGGDGDPNPTNEIQELSKNSLGQIVLTSNNGLVTHGAVDDLVDDADADATNEIQTLTLDDETLLISGGNSVDLSKFGTQTAVWSKNGTEISYANVGSNTEILYDVGKFHVGLGGGTRFDLNGGSASANQVMSFVAPNAGLTFYNGMRYTDLPPQRSTVFGAVGADTSYLLTSSNFSGTKTSQFELRGFTQNINYRGFVMAAGGGFGQFFQFVNNQPNPIGVQMGIIQGGEPFVGIAHPTTPNSVVALLSRMGTQGVKNFVMDHPTDETKSIVYACIEGPEAAAYERGTIELVDGEAFIPFTEHFTIVINPETMTVSLTPLSADSKGLAVVEKTANGIRVKELHNGQGNYKVDWEAKAVRKGLEEYKPVRDRIRVASPGENEVIFD